MEISKRLAVQAVTLLTHLFSNPNTTAHTMRGAERFDTQNIPPREEDLAHPARATDNTRMPEPNMAGHSSISSDYAHPNAAATSNTSACSRMANTQTISGDMESAAIQSGMSSVKSSEANHYSEGSPSSVSNMQQSDCTSMQQTPCRAPTSSDMKTCMQQAKPDYHNTASTAASVLDSGMGMMLAEKVLLLVKQWLTSEEDHQALLDLQQNPESHINQRVLIGRIEDYLEKHSQSMAELDGLISKSGITQSELAEASKDIGSGLMANIGAGIKNMFA